MLFKVIDHSGKHFYQRMDIRDLNIARWIGNEDEVHMKVNPISPIKDTPEAFDWRIQYRPQSGHSQSQS